MTPDKKELVQTSLNQAMRPQFSRQAVKLASSPVLPRITDSGFNCTP